MKLRVNKNNKYTIMSTENKDINKEQEEIQQEVVQDTAETQENVEQEVKSAEELLAEQLASEKDKNLRLFAEFENFRKRTAKERLELLSTASEGVMLSLLPVLDDFNRAIIELEKHGESDHLTGIKLIATKFTDTLSSKGLVEVEIKAGDDFNADLSEAVTQIPAGDEMKGKVVDVIERGYKLGEKVIRFPKVVIGQ
ncbi:nucleotide exchange factor GrpE [Myroides odoratimimus]|uniref:nucleotide exchange factor GrpE n=1 Tax=Myroides odoratimimus TaxID=76832 RepID=UPI00103FD891|nr:nucleotide exchange factor GrpE [Myroides odoratimimus]MCA4792012.1 nucleotide exchange factor GrpE [Myroides odoratimimus]MCA4819325.1 nucleotide exchange factor GrpE [Myroides odoratimimus]MCS7472608.1 nucleotide exchange factor GrpE [Myroides odoratimimus]MDM1058446.1 nucleotide exchange factor GrpE [Myroides odoratimimus]MDM1327075.1 nucleotide exchange factor GrpE [Myroides odoratimimus]